MLLDLSSLVSPQPPQVVVVPGGAAPFIRRSRPRILVPMLTSIEPETVAARSAGFLLTVNGGGFVGTSVVRLDGSPRPTTFISAGKLAASILARDVVVLGVRRVTVVTPGTGISNEMQLRVVFDRRANALATQRLLLLLGEL